MKPFTNTLGLHNAGTKEQKESRAKEEPEAHYEWQQWRRDQFGSEWTKLELLQLGR